MTTAPTIQTLIEAMPIRQYEEAQESEIVLKCLDRDELGDAELFAYLFKGKVIFDHKSRKWHMWESHYWQVDHTEEVKRMVGDKVASLYLDQGAKERESGQHEKSKLLIERAKRLHARKRIDNVLNLAQGVPEIKMTGGEWDTASMVLPCKNGVIDLCTGEIRPGSPKEYLKAYAPIEYKGLNEPSPIFEKTVSDIFGDDLEMVGFAQRLFGYCLTGLVAEHIFPILWGAGRNGKTTLLEIIAEVLGDAIAQKTSADSLMELRKHGEGPQPFLMQLRGKKLVYAAETKASRSLNVSMIKECTGGDTINGRGMYKDAESFRPTFTIFLLTNPKPRIPADDDAIWERVLLIEFPTHFTDEPQKPNDKHKDKLLLQRLQGEKAGILAWLVRGCLAYQQTGLAVPAKVKAKTEAYREEEDVFGLYLDERTITQPHASVKHSAIYKDYCTWASSNNFDPINLRRFREAMVRRFGEPKRTNDGMFYAGLGLLQS